MRRESRRQHAEIPTAIRPRDIDGHTAESPRTGHTRTRSHTDMLAHRNCTSTTPCRTGWGGGTLVYSSLAGPGRRPWAQKPGEKKNQSHREETPRPVTQRRNTTTSHSEKKHTKKKKHQKKSHTEKKHTKKKKQRTFCHRYVSAHSDATMFLENYTAIIRFGNTFGHTSLFL